MPAPNSRDYETRPPEDPLANLAVRQARLDFQRGARLRPTSPSLLSRRTRQIHEDHGRRARQAGVKLDYSLVELRALIERKMSASGCLYCRRELTARSFAVTHKNPPRRGGRHALVNLIICCKRCRALKGMLDAQEFQELLLLTRAWPEAIRRQFLACLLAGRRRGPVPPPDAPHAA
jgi:5-methylcytosine-specific restriction endonuclease McrA